MKSCLKPSEANIEDEKLKCGQNDHSPGTFYYSPVFF